MTTFFFAALLSLFKLTGKGSNLPKFSLSISDFKLAKSAFFADLDVSKPVSPF